MRIVAIEHVQLGHARWRERTPGASIKRRWAFLNSPRRRTWRRGAAAGLRGALKVHLGVDPDFRPARKAHAAFSSEDLAALRERLEAPDSQHVTMLRS